MNIAITGANGFIGRHLCRHYLNSGHNVLAITRRNCDVPGEVKQVILDYSNTDDWATALEKVDVLVHLAGIAHTRKIKHSDYYSINLDQTQHIARAAARSRVSQFIFFSSIKVNGESTNGHPFSNQSPPNPRGHYATSKWLAEKALADISADTGMATTVIRPPLVYGDTPKGNLKLIETALKLGIPLPLQNIANKRDLVSLENLTSLLDRCLLNPSSYGKTLLVSDGQALSTSQIVSLMAKASGIKPRLFTCPKILLSTIAHIPGLSPMHNKLFGNLEIDIGETSLITGWHPGSIPEKSTGIASEQIN